MGLKAQIPISLMFEDIRLYKSSYLPKYHSCKLIENQPRTWACGSFKNGEPELRWILLPEIFLQMKFHIWFFVCVLRWIVTIYISPVVVIFHKFSSLQQDSAN